MALAQRRLGLAAVAALTADVLRLVRLGWVDRGLHDDALSALVAADRREVSLVDHVSFAFVRRQGLREAFAFDRHFSAQGFDVVPARAG